MDKCKHGVSGRCTFCDEERYRIEEEYREGQRKEARKICCSTCKLREVAEKMAELINFMAKEAFEQGEIELFEKFSELHEEHERAIK